MGMMDKYLTKMMDKVGPESLLENIEAVGYKKDGKSLSEDKNFLLLKVAAYAMANKDKNPIVLLNDISNKFGVRAVASLIKDLKEEGDKDEENEKIVQQ